MLPNDRSIELIFNSFYFIFDYSSFIELQFNRCKLLLLFWFVIIKLMLSPLRLWLLIFLFSLIGSEFIDTKTCPQMCQKFFCGTYPNRTYGFSSPVDFPEVVVSITVGCSDFSTSIDWFSWYKISKKVLF